MMAATRYREKRRLRKAAGTPQLVSLGTVGTLVPAAPCREALTVVVGGRYEVRVGCGFDAPTLAQVVRTLEQL